MLKKIRLMVTMVMVIAMLPIYGICGFASEKVLIKAADVTVEEGGSVSVPIEVSGNTGICGATLCINYDSRLVLTGVSKGDALPTLTMTPPGNFSANPIKILWDGLEQDTTDGVMATLTFTVPDENGTYDISVSNVDEDIVDGDLNLIDTTLEKGSITVQKKETEKIFAENLGEFFADDEYTGDSLKATAFKANLNGVNGKLSFAITAETGETQTYTDETIITDADVVLGIIVSGLADPNAKCEITVK